MTHLRGVVGQEEHEDPGRVVVGVVLLDERVRGVLDLDAGHVVVDLALPDDDVRGLSDVDRRVLRARDHDPLHQHVLALHGVDAVEAGAVHHEVAEDDPGRAVDGDPVARVVAEGEALDREAVAGGDHGVGQLALAVEDRPLRRPSPGRAG